MRTTSEIKDVAPPNFTGKNYRYRDKYLRKGPNRNRRCPCGSGEKYKRCCYDLKK